MTAGSCDTPGLSIRLKPENGNMDVYEAVFVESPLQGQRLTSKVSNMNEAKWDQLQATAVRWQCPAPPLTEAERHHVVSAVIQLLEVTMAKRLMRSCGHDPDGVSDPVEFVSASRHIAHDSNLREPHTRLAVAS